MSASEVREAARRLQLPEDGVDLLGDTCPRCWDVSRRTVNWPAAVEFTDLEGGLRADYVCTRCGHGWFTGWSGVF